MMLPPDPVYIFKGDMAPVMCMSVLKREGSGRLYAGTQTGKIHVWDLKSNREIGQFQSSNESCISINFIDDPSGIITQDKMGIIKFWVEQNLEWALTKEIKTDYYGFCKLVIHLDTLYLPVKKGNLESWSVKTKQKLDVVHLTANHEINEITCFKIFQKNDETFAIVAFESCDLSLYSFKEKIQNGLKVDECPMALEFNVESMKGVCGCPTEKLLVFYVNKNFLMEFKRDVILKSPGVASLAIRPDGKLLAVGCWDGKLRLYSAKSLSILAVLEIHLSTIQDIVYFNISEENERSKFYIFAASKDGKVSMWDLYN